MPTLDQYQQQVIVALRKAGWQDIKWPYRIQIGRRILFADLEARRTSSGDTQQIIIVEVKGFTGHSPVHDLEQAIGQYVIYRALLEEAGIGLPLYLAVPGGAFDGILNEPIGQITSRRLQVKMIVFDMVSEEILQWLD